MNKGILFLKLIFRYAITKCWMWDLPSISIPIHYRAIFNKVLQGTRVKTAWCAHSRFLWPHLPTMMCFYLIPLGNSVCVIWLNGTSACIQKIIPRQKYEWIVKGQWLPGCWDNSKKPSSNRPKCFTFLAVFTQINYWNMDDKSSCRLLKC